MEVGTCIGEKQVFSLSLPSWRLLNDYIREEKNAQRCMMPYCPLLMIFGSWMWYLSLHLILRRQSLTQNLNSGKKIEIHSSCTLSELLDVPLGKRWQAFRPKPVFLCHDKFHRDRKICMDTLQAGSFLVLVVMIKSALLLRWNL